jgi:hypothetical protein
MTSGNARIGGATARSLGEILRRHRAWWLVPMVGVWLAFLAAVWLSQGEQAQPFLYSLF